MSERADCAAQVGVPLGAAGAGIITLKSTLLSGAGVIEAPAQHN